jgi:1-acyl-sn-glycerol-3-phosphate acyltransferase
MGDTVIPIVFYAHPLQRRLRFVLKKELLFDPCLDVVGHRLPNYFADRGSADSAREVRGVTALLDDLGSGEGVLIYPEGTRYSAAKRRQVLERLDGEAAAQARRWTHLLPPRYGGILALLQHNPGLDLLFCAHVGFEGSASFASLINGAWLDAVIRIHFWRVPFAEIPDGPAAQRHFFDEHWQRMEETVRALAE